MSNRDASLIYVFNAHLPFVKRHQDGFGFLEERWLFDALAWSYIPFITMMNRLSSRQFEGTIVLSLSPTLLTMLEDDSLIQDFIDYLDASILLGEHENERLAKHSGASSEGCRTLAEHYRNHYVHVKELFVNIYQCSIIEQLRILEKKDMVECITTAATYAFLPNIRSSVAAVRAQIKNSVVQFQRIFNKIPLGFFLPECGYYEGVEEELEKYGISYSFCDAQALLYADNSSPNSIFSPLFNANSVVFFPRDRVASDLICSPKGYIENLYYRDFRKDIGSEVELSYLNENTHINNIRVMTGYKYYTLSENREQDILYDIQLAKKQLEVDQNDYVKKITQRIDVIREKSGIDPVITQVFDLDLFGHRWYEGMDFLENIMDTLSHMDDIKLESSKQYLQRNNSADFSHVSLSFSSWSQQGYAQVWIDSSNKHLNRDIHSYIARYKKLVSLDAKSELHHRLLKQAGRELLLAMSSDWAFIMHANKFVDFAKKEIRTHLNNFDEIYNMLYSQKINFAFIHKLEKQNNIFQDFDYSMFDYLYH